MQALLKSGALKLDPLITDRMALAAFDRGVQLLLSGIASKVLLYPKEKSNDEWPGRQTKCTLPYS
jgi:hypothetical protein